MSALHRNPVLLLGAAACAVAAGCAQRDRPAEPSPANAVAAYGYGPQPDPLVTYQQDVILMSGGPTIIRGVSDDGLTWTIDGGAREAHDLAPGKIMFASSRAVGRVVDVERRGDHLLVSVTPVRLTEIVRNATLRIEQRLNLPSGIVSHFMIPDATIHVRAEPRVSEGVRLVRAQMVNPEGPTMTDGSTYSGKATAFGLELEPFFKSTGKSSDVKEESVSEIGVRILRASKRGADGPRLGGTVSLTGRDIRVRANLVIVDGQMRDTSWFVVEGVEGLDLGFVSGSEEATVVKVRLEDAVVNTGVNFMFGGLPMALTFKWKAYLEFAFSSSNSTLSARGRYRVSGPMGYENGAMLKPTITLVDSMLQSVEGHTIGPAGVVFATEFRVLLGVGNKDAAVSGGYGKITISAGVSQGSALGLPLAQCRGVTLKVSGATGWGLEINKRVLSLMEYMNRKLRPGISELKRKLGQSTLEVEFGKEFNIVTASAVQPNIPLCGGGK